MNYRMPTGEKGKVSLSLGNWIAVALFFGGQSIALLKVGVEMQTAQAVQEIKINNIESKVVDVKSDMQAIKTDLTELHLSTAEKIDKLSNKIGELKN